MEFVLELSDALAQFPRTANTGCSRELMASTFLVPLEYEKIKSISCPQCGGHSLDQTRSGSLDARKDLEWPYYCPGGDKHHCLCTSSGHSFPV